MASVGVGPLHQVFEAVPDSVKMPDELDVGLQFYKYRNFHKATQGQGLRREVRELKPYLDVVQHLQAPVRQVGHG